MLGYMVVGLACVYSGFLAGMCWERRCERNALQAARLKVIQTCQRAAIQAGHGVIHPSHDPIMLCRPVDFTAAREN